MGEVRCTADFTAGIAGSNRPHAAFVLDVDIPAFRRKGASGDLGGQPDFFPGVLSLGTQ